MDNQQETKMFNTLVGSSETTRGTENKKKSIPPQGESPKGGFQGSLDPLNPGIGNPIPVSDIKFNQWLAGYIDGDGYFSYNKKGFVSLEITTQIRDKRTLYIIKQKFGGSIKIKSGTTHLRYRLHHKEGLINLIHAVNG
jgi:hypothetical protein